MLTIPELTTSSTHLYLYEVATMIVESSHVSAIIFSLSKVPSFIGYKHLRMRLNIQPYFANLT